jgi:hypothetical protein
MCPTQAQVATDLLVVLDATFEDLLNVGLFHDPNPGQSPTPNARRIEISE